jgi:drug/metabolite transporter (DMT)-like permease
MGLAGVVSFSPLLYLGLRYSTAVNCSLIQGFSPLITALIAGLIIREPVTRRQLAGAVLGLVGVAGLLSSGSLTFMLQLQFNPGDLILLASAVVWAFYAVFGRRVMRNRSPVAATALSNFISLPLIAAAAAFELQYIPLNLRVETIVNTSPSTFGWRRSPLLPTFAWFQPSLGTGPGTVGSRPWGPVERWCSITPCPFTALPSERSCLASLWE